MPSKHLKPHTLTPSQAADWLEAMPPIEIKNRLIDLLLWQAKHNKSLVNFGWYARKMQEPKLKPLSSEWREMTSSIGKSVK